MTWYKKAQNKDSDIPLETVCQDGFCYRIDREKISNFTRNPYIMTPEGSSQIASEHDRGTSLPKSKKFFEGLYAGDNLGLIAAYALPKGIPWVLVYFDHTKENPLNLSTNKPTLYVDKSHMDKDHPPAYLSKFHKKDFKPRREITNDLFGEESTDTGDDEWLSIDPKAPQYIEQIKIKNIETFLRKYVDLHLVESNQNQLQNIVRSIENINSKYHVYSMIVTDGRGSTEIINP